MRRKRQGQGKDGSTYEEWPRGDSEAHAVSPAFLSYDRRSFGELLSDWQAVAAPGTPEQFIRECLGLDGALSRDDFLRLIADAATPSRELVLLASARVPPEVCSPTVLRNRGERAFAANREGRLPSIEVSRESASASRLSRLEEIAAGRQAAPDGPASELAGMLVERLQEKVREPLDAECTLANLEQFLNIAPEALRGRTALPPAEAARASEALAVILDIKAAEFDAFVDEAMQALTAGPDARTIEAGRFGTAVRFLRHGAGISQSEVQSRLKQRGEGSSAFNFKHMELGYIPEAPSIQPLCEALGCSQEESRVLSAIAERNRPDMARHPNIVAVAERFGGDGLTRERYYHAALKHPALFVLKPEIVAGNVTGVADRFAADGLTRKDYLHAALKQPSLFAMSPEIVAGNVTGVADHFAADGLTREEYVRVALTRPQLLVLKPGTIAGNIEGVVERFAGDGLTRKAYLRAALKQPQLFYQSPDTISRHINIVIGFAEKGIFTPSKPSRSGLSALSAVSRDNPRVAAIAFLIANPSYLTRADDNFGLREAHRCLAEGPSDSRLLRTPRYAVERALMAHLGQDDPGRPVPSAGPIGGENSRDEEYARRYLLRALMHAGLIRSGTLQR